MIKQLIKDLDIEICQINEKYMKLHEELRVYGGKVPTQEEIDDINRILEAIHETYVEMYDALYFITHRQQFCINVLNGYNEFVENLKKSGATEYKKGERHGQESNIQL